METPGRRELQTIPRPIQRSLLRPKNLKGRGSRCFVPSSVVSTAGKFCIHKSLGKLSNPHRGIVTSFGVFQAYYSTTTPPLSGVSAISWIGSTQTFLLLFIAPVSGRLCDAGYAHLLIRLGTALLAAGILGTSFSRAYSQVICTQGIAMGLGFGMLFTPSMAVLPPYFGARGRGVAIALAIAGSGFGGIVYPVLVRTVLATHGFGWSQRAMLLVVLATQVLPCALLRQRPGIPRRAFRLANVVDFSPLRDPRFAVFCAGVFVTFLGLFSPYFFLELWAQRLPVKLGFEYYYLASVMNAGGTFGRMFPAVISGYALPQQLVEGLN